MWPFVSKAQKSVLITSANSPSSSHQGQFSQNTVNNCNYTTCNANDVPEHEAAALISAYWLVNHTSHHNPWSILSSPIQSPSHANAFLFHIYSVQRVSSYPWGRYTRVDRLRSSPACSHWRSAQKVGSHTGTVPSGTCESNNMPSIICAWLQCASCHGVLAATSGSSQWQNVDLKTTTLIYLQNVLQFSISPARLLCLLSPHTLKNKDTV